MKEENNDDEIEDDSWALYADASYGNSVGAPSPLMAPIVEKQRADTFGVRLAYRRMQ